MKIHQIAEIIYQMIDLVIIRYSLVTQQLDTSKFVSMDHVDDP